MPKKWNGLDSSGNLPYDTESSNPVLHDSLEGWMLWEVEGRFKRKGTCGHFWLIYADARQKPTQYCKTIILQLKINKF